LLAIKPNIRLELAMGTTYVQIQTLIPRVGDNLGGGKIAANANPYAREIQDQLSQLGYGAVSVRTRGDGNQAITVVVSKNYSGELVRLEFDRRGGFVLDFAPSADGFRASYRRDGRTGLASLWGAYGAVQFQKLNVSLTGAELVKDDQNRLDLKVNGEGLRATILGFGKSS
jgi:hypothetical protein